MEILVVDDDEIVLAMLEHLLISEGHTVRTASNGLDALTVMRETDCRLIVSDWEMPGMSGIELCRKVRAGDYGGYVYLILLTSRDSSQEMIDGLAAGADDFITKPFNSAELKMRIAAGLRILSVENRDLLIFTLAKLAESRDHDTGQHLERVQRYSRLLAQELANMNAFPGRIDGAFIRNVFLTSPLHDIGKVGIPDQILLKPGKLSNAEFKIMKSHTIIGAETLAEACKQCPNAAYLKMALEIVKSHHERFDGTGYPEQLAGDHIPLAARIVAVADVYDALRTKRSYKDAFTHEHASRIITDSSGSHFDPRVVEAFSRRAEEFEEISKLFAGNSELEFDRFVSLA